MDFDMNDVDDFAAIDNLNNLEGEYYSQGYTSGFDHGRLHGLFEGRSLGQEKSFEIWEELGFIEGVALFWQGVSQAQQGQAPGGKIIMGKKVTDRAKNHITTVLDLISQFPTSNPSSTLSLPPSSSTSDDQDIPDSTDISALIERIRARYKLLCSSLGIRTRLGVANVTQGNGTGEEGMGGMDLPQGIEMGVEKARLRL